MIFGRSVERASELALWEASSQDAMVTEKGFEKVSDVAAEAITGDSASTEPLRPDADISRPSSNLLFGRTINT